MSGKEKTAMVSMSAAKVMKEMQKSMDANNCNAILDYVKLSGTHQVEKKLKEKRTKKV